MPALLPLVFDRWEALNSFDVCQEPFASSLASPPSLMTIDLTRSAADAIDWAGLDLAGIIGLNDRPGISVWAGTSVRSSRTWRATAEA